MSGVWNHLMRNLSDPVNLAGELGGMVVGGTCGTAWVCRALHGGRMCGKPVARQLRRKRLQGRPEAVQGYGL